MPPMVPSVVKATARPSSSATISASLSVASLCIYPVKGCRPLAIRTGRINSNGLQNDRKWAIVDLDSGRAVVQNSCSKVATVQPTVSEHFSEKVKLQLRAPGMPMVDIPAASNCNFHCSEDTLRVPVVRVSGYGRTGSLNSTVSVNAWLSSYLQKPVALMEIGAQNVAPIHHHPHSGSFANEAPILAICQASLDDLQRRINNTSSSEKTSLVLVDAAVFRANIVIHGGIPWQEDRWKSIQIGDVPFDVLGPCGRCLQVNRDETGELSPDREPLRTLSTFRRFASSDANCNLLSQSSQLKCIDGRILFGVFLAPHSTRGDGGDAISVGDAVVVTDCHS